MTGTRAEIEEDIRKKRSELNAVLRDPDASEQQAIDASDALTELAEIDAEIARQDWANRTAAFRAVAAALHTAAGKLATNSFQQIFTDLRASIGAEEDPTERRAEPARSEPTQPEPSRPTPPQPTPLTLGVPPTIGEEKLGSVSERFESSGNPGAIGEDSTGGPSYGTYQIATKTGTMAKFLDFLARDFSAFHGRLEQAGGNQAALARSAAFVAAWKDLARDPAFTDAQHEFIKATHYDVLVPRLLPIGLDVNTRHRAIREAVWSVSVQFGGGTNLIEDALEGLAPLQETTDRQLIEAIYNERKKVDIYFKSSTDSIKESLIDRFNTEEKLLLKMLA